jgi:uncharacterized membrane protein
MSFAQRHLSSPATLLAMILMLPNVDHAQGGNTGLLTLVVGIALMLLGTALLGIIAALRRRQWARVCALIVLAALSALGICIASDAWQLLNRGNEDMAIGTAFFALWGLGMGLAVLALRGARVSKTHPPALHGGALRHAATITAQRRSDA